MKRTVLFMISLSFSFSVLNAQILKNVLKKDSTGKTGIGKVLGGSGGLGSGLSSDEIANGLKEALQVGATKGSDKLSAVDGFFKDAAIKILMPDEAKKVEKTLRTMGLGAQVDEAILSMNRAAEDAAKSAAPIFINAIKSMSISDALGILQGGDNAATNYLKSKTTSALTEAFRPVIEKSLEKVNATKYWNTLFTTYNKVALQKVNPDLPAYVTEKGLSGIFYQVAQEEKQIRQDPLARTSDLLKKVFATK
ncbi:MAG: DUF4197 domain-containing protein [Chitinophagaceae bacterium]